jgi:hypothetical protein
MSIVLSKPGVDALSEAVRVLREWQYDGVPVQLHPGDLGWYWRFGAESAVRTWSRDGQILAVGLLDGPRLLRLAIAPDAQHDQALARQLLADLSQPERGVLPQGDARTDGRAPRISRPRLRQGDHPRRFSRASCGAGPAAERLALLAT